MYCKQCGMEIPDNALFCANCGIRIIKNIVNERINNAEDENTIAASYSDTELNITENVNSFNINSENNIHFEQKENTYEKSTKNLFNSEDINKTFVANEYNSTKDIFNSNEGDSSFNINENSYNSSPFYFNDAKLNNNNNNENNTNNLFDSTQNNPFNSNNTNKPNNFYSNYGQNHKSDPFANSNNNNVEERKSTKSLTIAILGIILASLNYFGVYYVHIIGLAFGIWAVTLASKERKLSLKYSTASFVFGIIAIILGGLAFAIGFFSGFFSTFE